MSAFSATAQPGYSHADDSIAEAIVMQIPAVDYLLKEDDYKYRHVRYRYTNHIFIKTVREPGNGFNYYWIQVIDSSRREGPVLYNFYVNPKNQEVKYFDTKSNTLLTMDEWNERNKKQDPHK